MIFEILSLAFGYIFGSIPFGLVLTRLAGLGDIRQIGSGNIGATNVLRTGRKDLAALTFILDAGKAAIPFLILSQTMGYGFGLFAGLGALIGHCYPVWLKFNGGKAVASTAGLVAFAHPPTALAGFLIWLCAFGLTRYSSLPSLFVTAFTPIIALCLWAPFQFVLVFVPIIILIYWRHRANILRLWQGTEPKIGQKTGTG